MKKFLLIMLSLAMVFSFTACKKEEVEEDNSPLAYTQEVDLSNYDAESEELYKAVYGEYYDVFEDIIYHKKLHYIYVYRK